MAGGGDGHDPWDDPSLKGIQRYFNNKTQRGRAHVAIATYVSVALYVVYRKFFKSNSPKGVPSTTSGDGCECNQRSD
nr:unnamed protein product [Callosobruchus analis]